MPQARGGHTDHPICGATTCACGGGHENSPTWDEISKNLSGSITLSNGKNYYLSKNIDFASPSSGFLQSCIEIEAGTTVTLCLNGHSIEGFSGTVIKVYGTLNLINCQDTGAITDGKVSDGGGVYVYAGGTLNMYGGSITGNTANKNGGGVYVNNGTFNMYGGSITDNTAASSGGGVYVNNGTFNMYGGSITGNTAASSGGGMCVSSNSVALYGGKIVDNTVKRL